LNKQLTQLQASEHEKFVAHLYQSRREYRQACETAGKSGKQIERFVFMLGMNSIGNAKAFPQSLQAWNCQCDFFLSENPDSADAAESMVLRASFRQWEDLLRIGDWPRDPHHNFSFP
jgi:hypothetical protein